MTEQNPAAPASESTPTAQLSSKGQNTSRVRGAAERSSRGRGKNNHNNKRLFQEDSEVKEFKHVTLVANGGPKQAQDMHMACQNYANTKNMEKIYDVIKNIKKKDKSEFLTAKIDPANCLDNQGVAKEHLKTTEHMRAKEEMSLQLKNWNAHLLLDKTLYNTVWGQCDNGIKAQLKAQKDFANAKKEGFIMELLCIVDQVCLSGKFGIVRDRILLIVTQHQELLNYTQLKERDTEPWLKDLADLYDTQVSLGGKLPFGDKIMIKILEEQVGAGTEMDHYYNSVNKHLVPDWDLEYKN